MYLAAFAAAYALMHRRASYGLAALILVQPFAFYRDVGPTTITLSKVVLVALVLALLARRADARALAQPAAHPLVASTIALVLATGLSITQAQYVVPAIRETLKTVEYLAIFAVAVIAATRDADERPIRFALATTVGAVALLALAQEITGAPSGIWFGAQPVPRIAGPLEGPNQLAGYLGLGLPMVAAFMLLRPRERFSWHAGVEAGALALGVAALILTLSRAGLIAGLGALAVVALAAGPRESFRRMSLWLGAGALAATPILIVWAASIGSGSVVGHLVTLDEAGDPGGVGRRSQLWHAALALWSQHPWLGIGAGNFELELARAGLVEIRTHANSLYVQSLTEGGLPLLAATVATLAAAIATFARVRHLNAPLVVGALGASIGFAGHQFVDDLLFFPKVGGFWWLVIGLGLAGLMRPAAPEPA